MKKLLISTIEEKKKIETILDKFFLERGYLIFTCEGLAAKDTNNVHLFERFETDKAGFLVFKQMLSNSGNNEQFLKKVIEIIIRKGLYTIEHYKFITELLKKDGFNYNIIIYSEACHNFLWISCSLQREITVDLLQGCKELSQKMYSITEKEEKKSFRETHYLRCIDECLRKENTPYPGNFDGIVYDKISMKPKFILEYSKVDWVYRHNKNIDYHLKWYCSGNNEAWLNDINRWNSLYLLGEFLGIPIFIIWWGTRKEEYAFGELKKVGATCSESIEIISNKLELNDLLVLLDRMLKEGEEA